MEYPQEWHFLQPSSVTKETLPHSGQRSTLVEVVRFKGTCSTSSSITPLRAKSSAKTLAMASAKLCTLFLPKPTEDAPPIPLSCPTIFCATSLGLVAPPFLPSLKDSETNLPIASASAMVCIPPFPTVTNTSKGWSCSSLLTVIKASP